MGEPMRFVLELALVPESIDRAGESVGAGRA